MKWQKRLSNSNRLSRVKRSKDLLDFKKLFLQEQELLDLESNGDKSDLKNGPNTETPGPASEPWISYTPIDRVGLAFSGGGI
jgi:hypothetical protein